MRDEERAIQPDHADPDRWRQIEWDLPAFLAGPEGDGDVGRVDARRERNPPRPRIDRYLERPVEGTAPSA